MNMLVLDSPYTDPRYNIAAEEYLLKKTGGEYAFLYINEPSLIIGKHQNAYAEVDLAYIRRHRLPVIRRISGGGAVWHDQGNLNFSFIINGEEGRLVNFSQYAGPVVEFLNEHGVAAYFGSRNEILVGERKISGNAEHVHRNRVLHHGTLLFSSDLNALESALKSDPGSYTDKAVQSIRSRVTNIMEHTNRFMDLKVFRSSLIDHFLETGIAASIFTLGRDDEGRVRELAEGKYSTWEWNIGYSPKYRLARDFDLEDCSFSVELTVEKGVIREAALRCMDISPERLERFGSGITGRRHEPGELFPICRDQGIVGPGHIDKFVMNLF